MQQKQGSTWLQASKHGCTQLFSAFVRPQGCKQLRINCQCKHILRSKQGILNEMCLNCVCVSTGFTMSDFIFHRNPNHLQSTFSRGRLQLRKCFRSPQVNHRTFMLIYFWCLKLFIENLCRTELNCCGVITCPCCSPEWGAGAVSSRACGTRQQIFWGKFSTS